MGSRFHAHQSNLFQPSILREFALDPSNALALAYSAEVLADQQHWAQAKELIEQALSLDANSMDVHRVAGYIFEGTGDYEKAIAEYQIAIQLEPNLAFLYLQVGGVYRVLGDDNKSSEYYQSAMHLDPNLITTQIGDTRIDYVPYIKYLQSKLANDRANPRLHGELGLAYFKSLNYESALIELGCTIEGCTTLMDTVIDNPDDLEITIRALPLSTLTLEYYYTYNSILASLHNPNNNYCQRAADLDKQIHEFIAAESGFEFVLDILAENKTVCEMAGATISNFPPSSPCKIFAFNGYYDYRC